LIIRILNEGQYELDGEQLSRLDELDHRMTEAVACGNEPFFQKTLDEMIDAVRNGGARLPDDALTESHLVLPPPDTTLSEARRLFSGIDGTGAGTI